MVVHWLYRDNSIRTTNWTTSEFATNSTGSISSTIISEGGELGMKNYLYYLILS